MDDIDIRLPKNIPLFPLPGVLLLPGGILPLHIFEQRYLQMFRDALQGDGIIGMIQPSTSQYDQTDPPVYMTGCTGKITHHEDTSDDRMLVTLRGLCRFNIVQEHDGGYLYRTAEVDYLPSGNILRKEDNSGKHRRLLNAASLYLPLLEENSRLEPILEAGMSELVTALAMHCPFSTVQKQSLLEASDVESRVDRLIELLEQAALDSWPAGEHTAN
ncbi:MAG: LON peptidase substrate-binding domain-containing protein [Gammaproteobacteria bacterium]|nr:MAG: LON peptidase substrate-binding domain-containing protein [Gammaproteobacteria bacterium]